MLSLRSMKRRVQKSKTLGTGEGSRTGGEYSTEEPMVEEEWLEDLTWPQEVRTFR